MMEPLAADDPRSAGEFRLRARLGAGGMGRVFLGYSPAGRAVAVKICHPEFAADPVFVRRFAFEVAAARSVNGLYTAQVIDAGPNDRPPWLATSYVPGPSLYDAVTADGPLPQSAVWRLAGGLAEALAAVHARGLVHRDLKPTNVLLATDGPRVIDFGVARALDGTSLTTTGITFGTPSYMSPEQGTGDPIGPASDVFALGCVLCFAATGGVPFGDGDPPAVLYRVVYSPPVLDAVPPGLRELADACLAKNPAERPTLAQILRACQDRAPQPGDPAYGPTSFWPGPVAALIGRHQAGLRIAAAALEPAGPRAQAVDEQLAARLRIPPQATPWPTSAQTSTGQTSTGQHAAGQPVVDRRRALAGLGGVGLAAALGFAGWELTSSGPPRPHTTANVKVPSRLAWSARTGGQVASGAAVADGVVYIGCDDGYVYAFEAATGRPVKKFSAGGAVSAPVTVAGGSLLAGSDNGKVHFWPLTADAPSWTYATGGAVRTQPTVNGATVYVGSDDHYVYALHAGANPDGQSQPASGQATDSSQLIWRHKTGGAVRSTPMVGHGSFNEWLYAGSGDGYLYELDTDNGHVAWRWSAGGAVNSGPAQDSQAGIYAGSATGLLCGLAGDPADNGFDFPANGAVSGTPVVSEDTVYFGSADASIYAVGTSAGQQIWTYPTSGPVRSGLAVNGNLLYAGSDDGYLYAIDVTAPAVRWKYRTGGPIQSQILVANDLVYFGSLDHHLYALHA